ncbi:uncharacterized protein THITE_2107167 [Thermothielavioides terrestris NRRL 8126]|uniref:Uncharacterized protein n=1 Tax=Thermothielavioides terrestris (strain ATCC 38088 / NRRL 8126) TaxID=578455 RepID=G2QSX3_THETT|nr:uncharacterized protein THITE_2107167 [Thermothielavioides terrestris NRRL 8126]AEO62698.1 hypothetical protein THITE_2107167 [Thermothielavioides terrestris NRRL 8126]
MPATGESSSVSMPLSPAPPTDKGTYARSMQQHTKRQIEAISQSQPRSAQHSHDSPTFVADGVSGRSRDSNQHSHQT